MTEGLKMVVSPSIQFIKKTDWIHAFLMIKQSPTGAIVFHGWVSFGARKGRGIAREIEGESDRARERN